MKNLLMTTIAIFGFALISNAQVPNYVPSNGLVAWYPYNGNTNDESGNGSNSSASGVLLTNDRFGNSDKAYAFAGGNNSFIQTPISSSVSSPDFTISCWAIGTESVENSAIIAARNTLDRITSINYQSGATYMQIASSTTTTGCNANNDNFNGSWHHFVVSFGNNTSYIYVDGILQNSCSIPVIPVITAQFKIGLDDLDFGGIPRGFIGSIDDVGFWNRTLTQEEITSLYLGSSLGINEVSQSHLFSVFPNPAQNEINVNLDGELVGSVYTIYDNIGKAVKTGKLNSVNTTIELNDLSGGIYTFSFGENKKQTFKVIKE